MWELSHWHIFLFMQALEHQLSALGCCLTNDIAAHCAFVQKHIEAKQFFVFFFLVPLFHSQTTLSFRHQFQIWIQAQSECIQIQVISVVVGLKHKEPLPVEDHAVEK